jgi:hypothetical protein
MDQKDLSVYYIIKPGIPGISRIVFKDRIKVYQAEPDSGASGEELSGAWPEAAGSLLVVSSWVVSSASSSSSSSLSSSSRSAGAGIKVLV